MPIDPFTLMMLAVLAMMVIFMIRNSRKQKADREALAAKVVKGANVMTTSGIFGTVLSIDEDENEIVVESTPGTKLRIHRQAVVSVVEKPVAEADALALPESLPTLDFEATAESVALGLRLEDLEAPDEKLEAEVLLDMAVTVALDVEEAVIEADGDAVALRLLVALKRLGRGK